MQTIVISARVLYKPVTTLKLEWVYLPKGKYCVYPRMVYRLAIVTPPPPIHFRAIRNFDFFSTKWLPAAILDDQSHFSPFQTNTQFFILFTKWLPATILDDQKSLSNAFLAISDQYATFFLIFFSKLLPAAILEVRFWPFWMTENH